MTLDVDTVIVCAGQEPLRTLYDELVDSDQSVEVIGGAYEAAELDAKAAINQASEKAKQLQGEQMGALTQGLDLGGLSDLMGGQFPPSS